ncbi:MAG TPA: DUF3302 domain-containing protein [Gammaproteobacteria bacterium]|nr:DUF3302 domain-containing protein [Gammaproteobacteria bacterium]
MDGSLTSTAQASPAPRWSRPGFARLTALAAALAAAGPACAASSEFVDSAAHVLALFIIFAVPIGGIVLFWLVHVLPEKIAHKRHHPQRDAIQVLCLLSLVFGGLLWPLAWLWAYTKPVLHKMAYGRDKHDDYYEELDAEQAAAAGAPSLKDELARLRGDVDALAAGGQQPAAIEAIRARLALLEQRAAVGETAGGAH